MNQHEWVYGCYQYYLENHIEPGNPEDGVWEKAHWPVPKCKGGSKTILLLKQHHAVQGVLQSEEWQTCCVAGWEKHYLEGDYLEMWQKWKTWGGKKWGGISGKITAELGIGCHDPTYLGVGGKIGGKIGGKKTAELGIGLHDPEVRKRASRNGGKRASELKKGIHSPEWDRSKTMRDLTLNQVWESTEDGFRGNPGNVAKHNKQNGWDPNARVRVS